MMKLASTVPGGTFDNVTAKQCEEPWYELKADAVLTSRHQLFIVPVWQSFPTHEQQYQVRLRHHLAMLHWLAKTEPPFLRLFATATRRATPSPTAGRPAISSRPRLERVQKHQQLISCRPCQLGANHWCSLRQATWSLRTLGQRRING